MERARYVSKMIEVSELFHSRARLVSPRFRLHALLALIPTGRRLALRTTLLEQEVTACLERTTAESRGPVEVREAVPELVPRCFDPSRADLAQRLAGALFLPKGRAESLVTRTLLRAGWTDEARDFAAGLEDRHLRYRMTRLATLDPSAGHAGQAALADAAVAAYHAVGLAEAVKVHRSIRYRSQRERAWYLVLAAALDAGRPQDAWRVLGRMRAGAERERACLRLARDLLRRGRPARARHLLTGSFDACRHLERDLVFAGIRLEEGRARHALPDLERRLHRPYEDLSRLDRGVPVLRSRFAVLALRQACGEEGFDEDLAILARRTLDVHDPSAVRLLLAAAAEGHLVLGTAVEALGRYAYDPVHSEWISERARLLRDDATRPAAVVPCGIAEAFIRGLRGDAAPRDLDANDPARCAYDEGVSLKWRADRHRQVLVRAAKATLKLRLREAPAREGTSGSRYVLASRLRILLNLGGKLASEHLRRALADVTAPTPAYRGAMMVLIALDPRRAAELYFRRHVTLLLPRRPATREIVEALEMQGVLERGFTSRWMRFLGRVDLLLGRQRAGRWLEQLTSAWSAVPSLGMIECLLSDTAKKIPPTGDEIVARSRERVRRTLALPPWKLVPALIGDPMAVQRVEWVLPTAFPAGYRRWGPGAWEHALLTIRDGLGKVDASRVLAWARRLAPRQVADTMARCWFWGSSPLPTRLQVSELPAEASPSPHHLYRLRYLDKRRDFFPYLRFADCVPCCFHSRSSWYRRTQWWVLALWKDPLSFCFHIESRLVAKDDWRPRGFVFGSFGLVFRQPAVLLNGVYLRRQHGPLRAAVLEAVEESFCRPLGISWVGVANAYGGYGELPDSYVRRQVSCERWRALRTRGQPVTEIYDDLTRTVNRPTREDHIRWKRLAD